MIMRKICRHSIALFIGWLALCQLTVAEPIGKLVSYSTQGRSLILTAASGHHLRLTPYGSAMLRVQIAAPQQDFFADDHYHMIERHDWDGAFTVVEQKNRLRINLTPSNGSSSMFVDIDKSSLALAFGSGIGLFLREKTASDWKGSEITQQFVYDADEHFTGLGHGYYGRVDHLDLRGQELERNYQRDHEAQAPLIVPFYISSKGYGVFLNSSFRNRFRFGVKGDYSFAIDRGNYSNAGQMDYVVIAGPGIKDVLRNYISLTGQPRLPAKAMFGIALSDKGAPKTSDATWWQQKVQQHRDAGFAFDHIVNDNRWRAAGGERCKSKFAWDSERYPNPRHFAKWATLEQVVLTLDFNRCIAPHTEGYKTAFNIPNSTEMDFSDAAPDLTNPTVRKWWWQVIYQQGIKPLGKNAAPALWIDEFDQMGPAPDDQTLANGRSFAEMRNYWFMLVSESLVSEGWDKDIGATNRPFVWVRGNTAGAQRYSTLWSGDIQPTYDEMQSQIRGMQAAGLSGFPFWGHDAGGFDASGVSDFDTLYRQWGLAMGSFSPFWKPHGIGPSRWPLDRSPAAQADFTRFSQLRYQLMPYTYTYAHRAFATGEPIARPMLFNYPQHPEAWQRDLQYLWGDQLLVAPNTQPATADSKVSVWLPPEQAWYNFWNDQKFPGGQTILANAAVGQLPLFVAEGAIIPMALPALSIGATRKDLLDIHIYAGANGKFTLYEDDEQSEQYRQGHFTTQEFGYDHTTQTLEISPVKGHFKGMTNKRRYRIVFHGADAPPCLTLNGRKIDRTDDVISTKTNTWWWSEADNRRILNVNTPSQKRSLALVIRRSEECPR